MYINVRYRDNEYVDSYFHVLPRLLSQLKLNEGALTDAFKFAMIVKNHQMQIGRWRKLNPLASELGTGGIVGSKIAKAELFAFPVLSLPFPVSIILVIKTMCFFLVFGLIERYMYKNNSYNYYSTLLRFLVYKSKIQC